MLAERSPIRLALIALLFAASGAAAQDPGRANDKAKQEATHDEIRALRDGLLAAIKAKNADAAIEYLHPDVVVTAQDGTEQKTFRKHAGVRDYLGRQLTGPGAPIKSLEPALTVDELTILHGDDTGIAFGSTKDHYVLTDGQEFDLPTRWSATLVRHEGRWKVANVHLSTSWFDNPVTNTLKRQLYLVGGIAAAAGLVVGLLLMYFFRRPSGAAPSARP
jgi:ketosteroid isomerase-like protein